MTPDHHQRQASPQPLQQQKGSAYSLGILGAVAPAPGSASELCPSHPPPTPERLLAALRLSAAQSSSTSMGGANSTTPTSAASTSTTHASFCTACSDSSGAAAGGSSIVGPNFTFGAAADDRSSRNSRGGRAATGSSSSVGKGQSSSVSGSGRGSGRGSAERSHGSFSPAGSSPISNPLGPRTIASHASWGSVSSNRPGPSGTPFTPSADGGAELQAPAQLSEGRWPQSNPGNPSNPKASVVSSSGSSRQSTACSRIVAPGGTKWAQAPAGDALQQPATGASQQTAFTVGNHRPADAVGSRSPGFAANSQSVAFAAGSGGARGAKASDRPSSATSSSGSSSTPDGSAINSPEEHIMWRRAGAHGRAPGAAVAVQAATVAVPAPGAVSAAAEAAEAVTGQRPSSSPVDGTSAMTGAATALAVPAPPLSKTAPAPPSAAAPDQAVLRKAEHTASIGSVAALASPAAPATSSVSVGASEGPAMATMTPYKTPKTVLNELTAKYGWPQPTYTAVQTGGASHMPTFTARVEVVCSRGGATSGDADNGSSGSGSGKGGSGGGGAASGSGDGGSSSSNSSGGTKLPQLIVGEGTGSSKREAEQAAARAALENISRQGLQSNAALDVSTASSAAAAVSAAAAASGNPKGALQEIVSKGLVEVIGVPRNQIPQYVSKGALGPDHSRVFTEGVRLKMVALLPSSSQRASVNEGSSSSGRAPKRAGGSSVVGAVSVGVEGQEQAGAGGCVEASGTGPTRKAAQVAAAAALLKVLRNKLDTALQGG